MELIIVKNGVELLECISGIKRYSKEKNDGLPDVILIDINMPYKDGFEALEDIKSDNVLAKIPVFLWSTCYNEDYMHKQAFDQTNIVRGFSNWSYVYHQTNVIQVIDSLIYSLHKN